MNIMLSFPGSPTKAVNNFKWILFISIRYFRTRKNTGKLSSALISATGIAVGVMAMIVILGVMNGFQLGFINDILEINSFHIRLYSTSPRDNKQLREEISRTRGVKSVLPFIDLQTLGKGDLSDFRPCTLRAVPVDAPALDPDLIRYLGMIHGHFDVSGKNSIVIGSEYASMLGVRVGDTLSLISMAGSSFRTLAPVQEQFLITGIFKSGYYEYDSSMGFVSFSSAAAVSSGKEPVVYGIKLKNRYGDRQVVTALKREQPSTDKIISWRDYNRAFFGALRMEKISMILLVGLIFFVVGVNIKHSLERSVHSRREDIGVLRSLGAVPGSIKTIFLFEGILTGFSGGIAGVLLGLAVTVNVNAFFSFLAQVTGFFLSFVKKFFYPFSPQDGTSYQIFSPVYFYIQKVPVKILFHEVFFIFLFALFSSSMAAWIAASKISEFNPAEILRYE